MKKRLWSISAAEIFVYGFVFCIVAAIVYFSFIHGKLISGTVDKIILKTTSYERVYDTEELTTDEINQFVTLYNRSTYAGKAMADPADIEYYITIVFQNGNTIHLRDLNDIRIQVSIGRDDFWVKNPALYQYIHELIQVHHMKTE